MQIKDIQGINKQRDIEIIRKWVEQGESVDSIATEYKMSVSNVRRILWENRGVIKLDKNWEKVKRIHLLQKEIRKKKSSKKDLADLIEQLRKEVDGDKPNINITQEHHDHITYRWERHSDQVQPPEVSGRDTQ